MDDFASLNGDFYIDMFHTQPVHSNTCSSHKLTTRQVTTLLASSGYHYSWPTDFNTPVFEARVIPQILSFSADIALYIYQSIVILIKRA